MKNELRPFACSQCAACFTLRKFLQNHQSVHSDQKDHVCEICHRSYKYRKGLNRHYKQSHYNFYLSRVIGKSSNEAEGEAKLEDLPSTDSISCSKCGQQFTSKDLLKRHRAIHVEKRQYKCSICICSYKFKTGLLQHYKRHHYRYYMTEVIGRGVLDVEVQENLQKVEDEEDENKFVAPKIVQNTQAAMFKEFMSKYLTLCYQMPGFYPTALNPGFQI